MQRLYDDTRILDAACRERYGLTEDVMMENAAAALERAVYAAVPLAVPAGTAFGGGAGAAFIGDSATQQGSSAFRGAASAGTAFGRETCALGASSALGGAGSLAALAGAALGGGLSTGEALSAFAAVLVLCGSGNNGGDGWALARRLCGALPVTVCEFAAPKTEIARLQKDRAARLGVRVIEPPQVGGWLRAGLPANGRRTCVVVDCVFGSGFHGELPPQVRVTFAELASLRAGQAQSAPQGAGMGGAPHIVTIACDLPSGLSASGAVAAGTLSADVTVTMGAAKTALFLDAAKDVAGRVVVAPLGVGRAAFERLSSAPPATLCPAIPCPKTSKPCPDAFLLEETDARLPRREVQNVHKGSFGHVAVCLGEKPGAAILAGSSALSFGAGLVTLVAKPGYRAVFALPGAGGPCDGAGGSLCNPCGGTATALARETALQESAPLVPPSLMVGECFPVTTTAVVLGPGFGRGEDGRMAQCLDYVRSHPEIGVVLDADAFYYPEVARFLDEVAVPAPKVEPLAVEGQPAGAVPAPPRRIVLTPHPKEFASLLELCGLGAHTVPEIGENKIALVKEFCARYPGAVLLLKGATTVIGAAGETCASAAGTVGVAASGVGTPCEGAVHLYLNALGSSALAKAGSGDVLSGMTAALLAQGYTAKDAACTASVAHALAARRTGANYALTPEKLIEALGTLEASLS